MERYKSALLGGLFVGVLSSLPVVGSLNTCCCLWVVAGGVLTVYLRRERDATPIVPMEAALQGMLAGAIGAMISVAVMALFLSGVGAFEDLIRTAFDQNPQVPVEVRDMVVNAIAGRGLFLLAAMITVPVYSVFGMLGALLGVAIFKKKTPTEPQP